MAVQVDENLGFLDGFVQQQAANGARQYSPPTNDDDDVDPAEDGYVSLHCVPPSSALR